ncbi:MAG: IgGFc-binding protein [Myxococcales bacterium]|nr:IgGFc-binding protein [Myxococcales bacterium]
MARLALGLGLGIVVAALGAACSAASGGSGDGAGLGGQAGVGGGAGGSGAGAGAAGGAGGLLNLDGGQADSGGTACLPCSDDYTQVLNCDGSVKETCAAGLACGLGKCMDPCQAAAANKTTVGCDYYAVALDAMGGGFGGCFVAFVANTWSTPVHLQASFGGAPIDLGKHAARPVGTGTNLKYQPYDTAQGLPPGEVAILFLANDPVAHGNWASPAACPVPAAVGLDAHVHWGMNISTGRAKGFHIETDRPVVAYQMLPFNAAYSATTGATLLLPTSAWDTNYVAVNAYAQAFWQGMSIPPSMTLIAKEDGTTVTILPKTTIKAGINVAEIPANTLGKLSLNAGETVEFIQSDELTGSPIQADKPIGLFAGHLGLRLPAETDYSDHSEQQIPPVRALGHEYAVASYRDRVPGISEKRKHRFVGAVDGTELSFDPPIPGAPGKLELGSVAEVESDTPFVVKSQDAAHPFMVFTYMSSSGMLADLGAPAGYGDPDFLRMVAGQQYMKRYVFFTDPTYPETNLVVIRRRGDGGFADVTLDCAGKLDGFQPIGASGQYEFTRVDLSRHNFEAQGNCNNGRREMTSSETFGLYVWGWGTPETRPGNSAPCDNTKPDNTCDVSYAYPAGENLRPINTVVVIPTPK